MPVDHSESVRELTAVDLATRGQHSGVAFTTTPWSVVLEAQGESPAAHAKRSKSFAASIGDPFIASCSDKGRWREAVASFERALSLDPRNAEIAMLAANNHLQCADDGAGRSNSIAN